MENKKKIYHIQVEEILQKIVEVEADSFISALNQVEQMYHDEQIVLDPEDLKEVSIRQV